MFYFLHELKQRSVTEGVITTRSNRMKSRLVCLYVYHRICLDFNYGPRNRGSFVRSQLILNYTPKGKVNTVSSEILDKVIKWVVEN